MKRLPALLIAFAVADTEAGVEAYREGRYEDAMAAFAAGEGTEPSAGLLYNRALSALGAGLLLDAEAAADDAARRDPSGYTARRDFLRGNVAFLRCLKSEELANHPESEPSVIDDAIAHAVLAKNAWQRAAMSRSDWPALRRNVERCLLKLAELEEKKSKQDQNRKKTPDAQPQQAPPKPAPSTAPPPPPQAQEQPMDLTPEQLDQLLKKLAQRKQEQGEQRRTRQRVQRREVEQDW